MSTTRYTVRQKIVHEIFDDEIILVNLENGNYFTLAESGAEIWKLAAAGAPAEEIVRQICGWYLGEATDISEAVHAFLVKLQDEQILTTVNDAADHSYSAAPLNGVAAPGSERVAFDAPVLAKYTDMEQLLVLDPIHDVDESGWPRVPAVPVSTEPA